MPRKRMYGIGRETDSGVYMLRNKITGNFYIGQSAHMSLREASHYSRLRRDSKFCNSAIKADYKLYGLDSFEFTVLIYCDEKDLLRNEQSLVDALHPTYNVMVDDVTSQKGVVRSAETREKMSVAKKKYWESKRA